MQVDRGASMIREGASPAPGTAAQAATGLIPSSTIRPARLADMAGLPSSTVLRQLSNVASSTSMRAMGGATGTGPGSGGPGIGWGSIGVLTGALPRAW